MVTEARQIYQPTVKYRPEPVAPRWISAGAFAELLGCTPRRARAIIAEQQWVTIEEPTRGGARISVLEADAMAYIEAREAVPAGVVATDAAAARKLQVIAPLLDVPAGGRKAAIVAAARANRIDPRTVRRWLRDYRAGGEAALIDKRAGNRNAAVVDEATVSALYTLWRNHHAPTAWQVWLGYKQLRQAEPERNLPELPYTTLRYNLMRIDEVLRARRGGNPTRVVKKYYLPPIERNWSTVPVMGIWMGDATTWDQLLVHPKYQTPIRGIVVKIIDVRSRFVVAVRMVVHLDGGTVMLALRDGWLRYGLCQKFWYDNGSEIVNKDALGKQVFRGTTDVGGWQGYFASLNVELIRSGVRNPEGKAPIERSFATDSHSFLNLFPAHTGANITAKTMKKDADRLRDEVRGDELLTWAEGQELMLRIMRAYNGRPHAGLGGRKPCDVFRELYGRSADGTRETPVTRVAPRMLDFAMRRKQEQKIHNIGCKVLGIQYRPDQAEHAEAFAARLAYVNAVGRKGYVAYDPENLRRVHLYQFVNGRPEWVCELRQYDKLDVTNEQDARRARADQKKLQKMVAQAATALIDRSIDAEQCLRAGVLEQGADEMDAHDAAFPPDGSRRNEQAGATLHAFPAGGAAQTPARLTAGSVDDEDNQPVQPGRIRAIAGMYGENLGG